MACEKFDLSIDIKGSTFKIRREQPPPVQISLFEALGELQDQNLEVKVARKQPGRIDLLLSIKSSSG
jgi:hypothetical protein